MTANNSNSIPNIPTFFAGRSIFVTGATGFLGKVLIEKLLRSCPDIQEIFLLMRSKKGSSIDNRLHKMLTSPLFDKVREQNPERFKKLIPVTGDAQEEGLGLPPLERKVITEKVSVIFHVAASVRFDDSLRDAIFLNTRSTRDICILAGSMKKLVALVHVSSTFAHSDKQEVGEITYPCDVDWKKSIKIAENLDKCTLNTLTAKYIDTAPNTYIFTKKLAEQVIVDYSKVLPCVIFRPSIVIPTMEEPVAGWLDNFNGPTGMMVGGGKGVLRIVYADPNVVSDYIPVDITIKGMIVAAWKRGVTTITRDPTPFVYNCCGGEIIRMTIKQLTDKSLEYHEDYPLESVIWHPSVTYVTDRTLHFILSMLFHVLPAVLIDLVLKLSGKRAGLLRIQRKIFIASTCLSFFMTHEWKFCNKKMMMEFNNLLPQDEKDFKFYPQKVDTTEYIKNCILGGKSYLLGEDLNRMEQAKVHYKRMKWISQLINVWALISPAFILYFWNPLSFFRIAG